MEKVINNYSASAEAVRAEFSQRYLTFPQWSGINPADVGMALTSYQEGDYASCAMLLEAILKYDSQLRTCFRKRTALSASCDWEISFEKIPDDLKPEAEKQAEVLRDFFSTLTVSDVMAKDAKHGVSLLFEQIASALAYGYSASAVEYFPAKTIDGTKTVHASITNCPLRFFEARTRRLRIRVNYAQYEGEPMNPKQWIISHSPQEALVLPSLVLFALKSTPLEDWCYVLEKFGIPAVLFKTTAQKGSPEWRETVKAASKFGSGYSGVIGSEVEPIINAFAQGNAPHERLIDYVDRSISRLWLGGDLNTMSREGDALGTNAQSSAEINLKKADCAFIESVIDKQVVRRVLDLVFGEGTRQLVYFRFTNVEPKNTAQIIQRIQAAQQAGIPVPKAWIYAELGIPQPSQDEETVFGGEQNKQQGKESKNEQENTKSPFDAKNSKREKGLPNLPDKILQARREDFSELLERLQEIKDAPEEDFSELITALHQDFGDIAENILTRENVADALASELLTRGEIFND